VKNTHGFATALKMPFMKPTNPPGTSNLKLKMQKVKGLRASSSF
jgi:hypothetical protein